MAREFFRLTLDTALNASQFGFITADSVFGIPPGFLDKWV